MTEVRITSATGGEKGKKPQQISTVDSLALLALAEVGGRGAEKYAAYNYLKGYDWSLSYDAAQRHLMQFWAGENTDAETGLLHVAQAAWHCLALTSFLIRDLGTDDRFASEPLEDASDFCAENFTASDGVGGRLFCTLASGHRGKHAWPGGGVTE